MYMHTACATVLRTHMRFPFAMQATQLSPAFFQAHLDESIHAREQVGKRHYVEGETVRVTPSIAPVLTVRREMYL